MVADMGTACNANKLAAVERESRHVLWPLLEQLEDWHRLEAESC